MANNMWPLNILRFTKSKYRKLDAEYPTIQQLLKDNWFTSETGIVKGLPYSEAVENQCCGQGKNIRADYVTLKKVFGKPTIDSGNGDGKIRAPILTKVQIDPATHQGGFRHCAFDEEKAIQPRPQIFLLPDAVPFVAPNTQSLLPGLLLCRQHFRHHRAIVAKAVDPRQAKAQHLLLYPQPVFPVKMGQGTPIAVFAPTAIG